MKIVYEHLVERIKSRPSIDELSEKLFQLGHEHEITNNIFDIEFTPNRGDCLSINGLLRDLSLFYNVDFQYEIYTDNINSLSLDFTNNAQTKCPKISFLKIELEEIKTSSYKGELESYFNKLDIKKNNFFTDISNYIAYETGQPTHCYDALKLGDNFSIESLQGKYSFETLLNKKIDLEDENLVFLKNGEIINLAGVVGGSSTACSVNTKSVIIECAYFNPDDILGKSVKYDISSEAAYKFERGVDPECQERVLRRLIYLVSNHASIKNIEYVQKNYKEFKSKAFHVDSNIVNNILGTNISENKFKDLLLKLGFLFFDNKIEVPSYRSDIETINDIAEEIARATGYNNISQKDFNIPFIKNTEKNNFDIAIKSLLIDNGFYEVINNPFTSHQTSDSIKIDNPLDSNRKFLRTDLKSSLIRNLLYNERRQKDSIKLFEISDVYSASNPIQDKRVLGIIASGRLAKNYIGFNKEIDDSFLSSILEGHVSEKYLKFELIDRNNLDSKLKNKIFYIEIDLVNINSNIIDYKSNSKLPSKFNQYIPISEFPSSTRDLSFSITDYSQVKFLEKRILGFEHELLKDIFVFDYYDNNKKQEIKMAFRFLFQSSNSTIKDDDVTLVMNDIIKITEEFSSVSIPGLKE